MPVPSGSGIYFVFAGLVFFLYWGASRWKLPRLTVVLCANYLFCAHFGLFYVVLLPLCSTVDYLVGLGLMRSQSSSVRRLLMSVSLAANLGVLIASRHMGSFIGPHWDWVFPLGLSFYTFQSLTYTFDLYRGDGEGTRSLLAYLSAASFFPTLQAGPITRVTETVKQLTGSPVLSRIDGGRAFYWIATGLLKKALIADYLADNLVNRVFDTPTLYSGTETLIAVYAYSLQLYYDFSGYTDIARGVGLLLGIRLPANFDRPYLSASLPEFWRRWHISFSNWLRDYLYFSLPGARTKWMPYLNLVVTMLLGGLWHGVTGTFAVWGLLHGTALAVTRFWMAKRGRAKAPASPARRAVYIFCTYQFVCLTWIFFRAGSLANAWAVLSRIGSLTAGWENLSVPLAATILLAAAVLLVGKEWGLRAMEKFAAAPFYVHALALVAVTIALQKLGGRGSAPFVYSRF
jgi:alginate O-acetyltransferase complex protein AlgI